MKENSKKLDKAGVEQLWKNILSLHNSTVHAVNALDKKFNKAVNISLGKDEIDANLINAWSLTGATEIDINTDLNNIHTIGNYYFINQKTDAYPDGTSKTLSNVPEEVTGHFQLHVSSARGTAKNDLRQDLMPAAVSLQGIMYSRRIYENDDGTWTHGEWAQAISADQVLKRLPTDPLCRYIKNSEGREAAAKDDTPENWKEIGAGFAYINGGNSTGEREENDAAIITDYPEDVADAFLINLVPKKDSSTIFVRQILLPYSGRIYTRYGNTKFTTWYKLLLNDGDQTTIDGSLKIKSSNDTAIRLDKIIDDSNYIREYMILEDSGARVGFGKNKSVINEMNLYTDRTELTQPLSVNSGGTGANTAAKALKNLGALGNSGNQTINDGSLTVKKTSTGAGVTVKAPLKIDDNKTVNIDSIFGPGSGTINNTKAPRTSIVHQEDDKEVNRLSLYNDRTVTGKPLTIASGGTGANTAEKALENLGALSKSGNQTIKGGSLTIDKTSTGAGVIIKAPLKIDDDTTVNIRSTFGPGSNDNAPRTSITHSEDNGDTIANRLSLYGNYATLTKPLYINNNTNKEQGLRINTEYEGQASRLYAIGNLNRARIGFSENGNISSEIEFKRNGINLSTSGTAGDIDMDKVFVAGAQFSIYRTDGAAEGTPYKAKLTGSLAGAYIITMTTSANYGQQIAYISGTAREFRRSLKSGNISNWKEVNINGSVTITSLDEEEY